MNDLGHRFKSVSMRIIVKQQRKRDTGQSGPAKKEHQGDEKCQRQIVKRDDAASDDSRCISKDNEWQ